MAAASVGVTGEQDAEEVEVKTSAPPAPRVELSEMIKLLGDEAGHHEIMAEFLKGRPNCDHRQAERKALVFQRALMTLELVQLYQEGFLGLIKSERAKKARSR